MSALVPPSVCISLTLLSGCLAGRVSGPILETAAGGLRRLSDSILWTSDPAGASLVKPFSVLCVWSFRMRGLTVAGRPDCLPLDCSILPSCRLHAVLRVGCPSTDAPQSVPQQSAIQTCCDGCVPQGNLADPLYFDFISYAQFATLSEAMETGRQEFEVRHLAVELGSPLLSRLDALQAACAILLRMPVPNPMCSTAACAGE